MTELSAPLHSIHASIKLSGSKSISNRLLILKEVLALDTIFQNLSNAEDTQLLEQALLQIKDKNKALIDIHHAGTDMRFLTALLSVREGEWTLTGSDRMKERPIGELVNALQLLGADISYLEKQNFPPLLIRGKKLKGGNIEINSSVSSQFISALLLIAPTFKKGFSLSLKGKTVSLPYIEMTIALLKSAGVAIEKQDHLINVNASSIFHFAPAIQVESDWSSASYWYSICALAGNAEIELSFLSAKSLQADSALPELYKSLGVKTVFKENAIVLSSVKPMANVFEFDFTNCPDIAQTIAVTCLGLGIKASLTGLSTLKVKETDRLLALKNELEKFWATVEIDQDSIKIVPPPEREILENREEIRLISTYNDHRMAMSFAPLALKYRSIQIDEPSVVSKSYPSFWEDLKSVGFNVNLQP